MCGLAGITFSTDKKRIRQMVDLMAHRGPDGKSYYEDDFLSLGHTRLSIIDLSEAGIQPMFREDFVIVFNGEIYNYIEIRKELKDYGVKFYTDTDTEVILAAYQFWGDEFIHKLNGMFAFSIYNKKTKKITLYRDPFGIKPLYYYKDNVNNLFFASEIKPLLNDSFVRNVNVKVLLDFLILGIDDYSEDTFFENIKQLLPGHKLIYDFSTKGLYIESYYNLDKSSRDLKLKVHSDEIESLLVKSIKLHLRSDVKIGTCLSGGLDSSIIAMISAKILKESSKQEEDNLYQAIHARSIIASKDESAYAMKVSELAKIELVIIEPSYKEFDRDIEKCQYYQEQPFNSPSVYMQYAVMKKAKEEKIKVMLDGQGADEVFLGYERYYVPFFIESIKSQGIKNFIKTVRLARDNSRYSFLKLLAFIGYFYFYPIRRFILFNRFSFVKSKYRKIVIHEMKKLLFNTSSTRGVQLKEISKYQLPHLLRYEDRNSMANSVEARVPFLEKELVQRALSLNYYDKIKDGFTKHSLRIFATKILPESIAWRKIKFGFESPDEIWLKTHSEKMKNEISNSIILKKILKKTSMVENISNQVKWRLYSIALWERLYEMKIKE
ncbi:MAG: asparagine synthase (glutamine-hydrolyzing) [Bacteroidetes bacterium]|nr:asparagine synthase (glutamine-hydrolyzing) [Bacteroidota bacterium]MBU1114863.1 asparagine synthase (glutamine-hydrolyzing) [Bacteroidota bacterium]MBU1798024.1 asparagine synthase (glutamine-hydrolyzing) [Bacteroidota bacterium]